MWMPGGLALLLASLLLVGCRLAAPARASASNSQPIQDSSYGSIGRRTDSREDRADIALRAHS
jgi:outer membrane biogenesis lipoprotein LolB